MTKASTTADGRTTVRTLFISRGEKESPMPNMRKMTPSCPTTCVESGSMRKEPPHVSLLMTTPARM